MFLFESHAYPQCAAGYEQLRDSKEVARGEKEVPLRHRTERALAQSAFDFATLCEPCVGLCSRSTWLRLVTSSRVTAYEAPPRGYPKPVLSCARREICRH